MGSSDPKRIALFADEKLAVVEVTDGWERRRQQKQTHMMKHQSLQEGAMRCNQHRRSLPPVLLQHPGRLHLAEFRVRY